MSEGTVKWFNPRKGFGFIKVDDSDNDVFVHANEITGGFRKELFEDQRVSFDIAEGPKGPMAKNARVID